MPLLLRQLRVKRFPYLNGCIFSLPDFIFSLKLPRFSNSHGILYLLRSTTYPQPIQPQWICFRSLHTTLYQLSYSYHPPPNKAANILQTNTMVNGSFTFESTHGLISVTDTALKNSAPALLLIHGNSSSSKIFKHIISSSEVTGKYRVVTFDLPGHGASSNSQEPEKSYSMRGYADLAIEILSHLNISSVVVLGWSLGGHIAIEMIPLLPPRMLKGILIIGTPPALGLSQTDRGFTFTDGHMSMAAKKDFTEDDIKNFSRNTAGEPFEQWMEDDVRRCDGKSRYLMWKKFAEGVGVDQRKVVEEWADGLVGVVNGGSEPFVNLDYLDQIKWKRLWNGKCLRLEGQGHAPFWEQPKEFESILLEFLEACEKV